MAKNTGRTWSLWKQLGWYSSSPSNLTAEEIKGKIKLGAGTSKTQNSLSFDVFLQASADPIQRQSDMATMAESEIVRPIIDVYVEECTQPDVTEGKTIWFECNDSSVEEELNKLMETLLIEDSIGPISRRLAGRGNAFRRVLYNDEEGIIGFVEIDNAEIERVFDPLSKRLLGFRWHNHKPAVPMFDDETIFPPWDFIHFRNLANDSEYGEALLAHLYPLYKRILLGMNQMTLYRISTMPNRHMLFLDSGDMDFTSGMENATMTMDLLRTKQMVSPQEFQTRYETPALDSILVMPIRKDENTKLELMKGDIDVPDIHDMEYMSKSLYGGARVPKAYLGHGDDAGNGLAQASLVSQDIRFARMVRVLRRPLVIGFYQLACIHLAMRGKDPMDYDIKVKMSKISALEEEVNAATLEKQVNLASSLTSLCKDLEIPNKEIIELVFREYLHVPRKFVDVLKLAVKVNQALGGTDPNGSSGGMFASMGGGMDGMGDGMGGPDDMGDLTIDDAKIADASSEGGNAKQTLLDSVLKNVATARRTLNESADQRATHARKARIVHGHVGELMRIGQSKKCSLVESIEDSPHRYAAIVRKLEVVQSDTIRAKLTESSVHPSVRMVQQRRKKK